MGDYQIQNAEKSKLANNSGHLLPEEFYTGKARGVTLDSSMKALSAVATGLTEGTMDKVTHFTESAKEKPIETLWHVGVGTTVGIGLALASKRLALLAGTAGSCEMLVRGFHATGKSFDSVMRLATTGTGYDEAKKTIASNFGQLSAEMLAMTATGAIAGGATWGGLKLRSIRQAKQAEAFKSHGGDLENAPIRSASWTKHSNHEEGHKLSDFDALWAYPSKEQFEDMQIANMLKVSESTIKKPTASLQTLSAKEAEHQLSGRNFLNKESPFATATPTITEGMSQLQLISTVSRDAQSNNKHLDWGLTRLIEKFTHGKDGDYIRMSAQGQSEMIANLSHVSRNVSRSEIGHAANLTSLSKVHNYAGRHQQELKLLEQSQKILDGETSTLGYTPELKTNLQRLADAYTAIGEPARAVSTAERLVEISKVGQATERVNALNNLGKVCNNIGATDKSLTAYEQAVEAGNSISRYDIKLFSMPNSKNLSELHQYFNEASELDKAKRCLKIMDFWNS